MELNVHVAGIDLIRSRVNSMQQKTQMLHQFSAFRFSSRQRRGFLSNRVEFYRIAGGLAQLLMYALQEGSEHINI